MNHVISAPIAVIGMHRSGTSCLAGSLEEAGLYLGQVNQKAPANARGNRENRAIMDLHDAVLADNQASWHTPRTDLQWSVARTERLKALIATYPANQVWGFKDPRSLFTLDAWFEQIPQLRLVGTVRHPLAVAASLQRRNDFPIERGLAIWQAYNARLLAQWRQRPFPVIAFDLPPEAYLRSLGRIADSLALPGPEAGFQFFSSQLRNAPPALPDVTLPPEVAALYATLRDICAQAAPVS